MANDLERIHSPMVDSASDISFALRAIWLLLRNDLDGDGRGDLGVEVQDHLVSPYAPDRLR